MSRRIEFIAPVEAMRGNMSGDQKLEYPTKNNSAWDAPDSKRSYALNYQPRYIGAKRSSDGRKYFAVRTKSAVFNSPAQRMAQALIAGSKLCADAVIADQTQGITLLAYFAYQKEHGTIDEKITFYRWLQSTFRNILANKYGEHTLPGPYPQGAQPIVLGNPWVPGSVPASAKIMPAVDTANLVKFWLQLSDGGIYITIGGDRALAFEGDDFDGLITKSAYNILGIVSSLEEGNTYIKRGNQYVLDADGNGAQLGSPSFTANMRFGVSTTRPALP